MPQVNRFRHQAYTTTCPTSPHRLLKPAQYPEVGSSDFRQRMQQVAAALRSREVAAIFLAHGTFVGPDALGALGELARLYPSAGPAVRRVIKRVIDKITGEVGNYTGRYARCFESAINDRCDEPRIPVWRYLWSSENNHIGRADGAVRLIDELMALDLKPGQRVLLWGHSHAGNVFALATNLLAGNRDATEAFFEAAEIYYRWPLLGCIDIPVWQRVHAALKSEKPPLDGVQLDVVTFGTPIRYGWDSGGYARLLHFINHRPAEGLPEYRAPFPVKLERVFSAADGDYVQQLGIAGTNVAPSLFAWRARLADQRLGRLLQAGSSPGELVERFQAGAIVPEEGTTLLVDYGRPGENIAQHCAGHAVYTRPDWMLFHAEEVARQFYGKGATRAA